MTDKEVVELSNDLAQLKNVIRKNSLKSVSWSTTWAWR